ncbi:MAG: hypothetical protein GY953_34230 [bacterium]|nr:hypothetical protein [bacterium]
MAWSTLFGSPILVTLVLVGVLGVIVLVRVWPRRAATSPEEREEMARAPMSPSQKGAWCGLFVGVATLAVTAGILVDKGAAEYWENDDLRMMVVAIFVAGIVAHPLASYAFQIKAELSGSVDEREVAIQSRAPMVQPPAILVTLAAWNLMLARWYHDEGAVPMVYLYLIFGSVILVMLITQSFGVLLGHWIGQRYGKG